MSDCLSFIHISSLTQASEVRSGPPPGPFWLPDQECKCLDNRRQHWARQNNTLEREKELSSGTTGAFHWFAQQI